MQIKLWGVRGSMPVSGPDFCRYGCATTCIEARTDSGRPILFDAGTGLANWAKSYPDGPPPVICLSHYHLDHILGLPFYAGIYDPEKLPDIYAPVFADGNGENTASSLGRLFDGVLFPLPFGNLPPQKLHLFRPGECLEINGAIVNTAPTCHAGGCAAFRLCADGWTFAWSGDHEIPLDNADLRKNKINSDLADFLGEADLVLADSHYSREDHLARAGWGHSDFGQWRSLLAGSRVKKLVFCHYSPDYEDGQIDALLAEQEPLFAESGILASGGREGQIIDDLFFEGNFL